MVQLKLILSKYHRNHILFANSCLVRVEIGFRNRFGRSGKKFEKKIALVEIDLGTEDHENVFGGNTKGRTLWFGRCKSWFES